MAFDTIFAEGQRKYLESLSAYARQFLGMMNKPDVKRITGLSPAISIEQKTTSKNPRSTVGTITEIYDYLRLLYAKIGIPYCKVCGRVIEKQSIDQIIDKVLKFKEGTKIQILAPIVKNQKGEHQKLLENIVKDGFIRILADGESYDLSFDSLKLNKNQKHNIDIVVDRLIIKDGIRSRLAESLETALKYANGKVIVDDFETRHMYSTKYNCPEHEIELLEISPKIFSFNSPEGACSHCLGLGQLQAIDVDLIIPDKNKTLYNGVLPFYNKDASKVAIYEKMLEDLSKHYKIKVKGVKIKDLPEDFMQKVLYGSGLEKISFEYIVRSKKTIVSEPFEGIVPILEKKYKQAKRESIKRYYESFMSKQKCKVCGGTKLKEDVLYILVGEKNIYELCELNILDIKEYLKNVGLSETETIIAKEILREINKRLDFLINVGLRISYIK